ncbi:helix-turn-helix domain-containing protein [Catellatospora sp. NPDC049609]|uniref:ATP-binding protein n=1 Tax=Catellatospora sp. NPDC049609 TaxID=3155505 RepID=UPI00341FEFBD
MHGGWTFGQLLRAGRLRAAATQEQLAHRAGLSARHVRDLEAGRITRPRPGTVALLADALGLSAGERERLLTTARPEAMAGHDPPGTTPLDTTPIGQPGPAPSGATPGARPAPAPSAGQAGPAQLPAALAGFTGRAAQLRRLDDLLDRAAGQSTALAVVLVVGTAGIGKTTLALHWAHRARPAFPDGQLYVDLRGFDPSGRAVTAGEAVRGFLDALGVPASRVPADLPAQAALFRSLLADRRMLIVLDNARDAGQVRPLLPGAPGCLVLVTARGDLDGLVAAEGAHLLVLDLLGDAEAAELLAARIGPRAREEPEALARLADSCARLPLALALVGARAALRPQFPLGQLAGELAEAGRVLDTLRSADASTDLRAVFSWSHRMLAPGTARLFRLLSLAPGPDITGPAAASLAGVGQGRGAAMLAELARAQLVSEHAPGRFRFHDLLRAYAAEICAAEDSAEQRRAALHRLLDHYLHTACRAALLLAPDREPIEVKPPAPGAVPRRIGSERAALAWFTAEQAVLAASIRRAAEEGFEEHAWQLVWTLADFLTRRGNAGPRGAARPQRDDAHTLYRLGLSQWADLAEPSGQARTELSLALAYSQQDDYHATLHHSELARQRYEAAGHRAGQVLAVVGMWWACLQLGDLVPSLAHARRFLALSQELGDRFGQAAAWDCLGQTRQRMGEHGQAVDSYAAAVRLFALHGEDYGRACSLIRLGDSHLALGAAQTARVCWREALELLEKLAHPERHGVLKRLAAAA